jgi:ATP-dependent exoDNAse (exonuclease V) alpha subunit
LRDVEREFAVTHCVNHGDLSPQCQVGLPIELNKDQQVALLRDYVGGTLVSRGMVADMALHLDNPDNPHAHVLLTTRQMTREGFGAKRRDWNVRSELREWRAEWAGTANQHLVRAGLDIRIDHRTLEAQGIDLVPGRKIGVSVERQQQPDLPLSVTERDIAKYLHGRTAGAEQFQAAYLKVTMGFKLVAAERTPQGARARASGARRGL